MFARNITALSVTAVLCGVSYADPSTSESRLEYVLVSTPIHKKVAETSMPVAVLNGDQLRRAASKTLAETLSSVPGVSNSSFGPSVGQPVIRGQYGPRVSVLSNGLGSGDAASVSADHGLAVEPLLSDSIEVLKGPSTLLYGGGAIGGVVNVLDSRIPRSLTDNSGLVEISYDSAADQKQAIVRLDGSVSNFAYHFDYTTRDFGDLEVPAGAIEAGSQLENTAGEFDNLRIGGSWHFDNFQFGMSVSRLEQIYGVPSREDDDEHMDEHDGEHEEHDEHEDEHDEHDEEHDEEHGGDVHAHHNVQIDMVQDRYDFFMAAQLDNAVIETVRGSAAIIDYEHAEIEDTGEIGTFFENRQEEVRLEVLHHEIASLHGVVGIQYKQRDFKAVGEEAYIPETKRRDVGLFIVEDFHWGGNTFEFGFRYDDVDIHLIDDKSLSRRFSAWSQSLSLLRQLNSGWGLSASISRSARAPVSEELYSNAFALDEHEAIVHAATQSIEIGTPTLTIEQSNNIDFGLNYLGDVQSLDVNVYYNRFQDFIVPLFTGEAIAGIPVYEYGQADAEFYGFEWQWTYLINLATELDLHLNAFGDFTRGRFISGGDIPRLPPHRVGFETALEWGSSRVWLKALNAASQDRPGDREDPTPSYIKIDLGAEHRQSVGDAEFILEGTINNLADQDIRYSTSFLRDIAPAAGRSVEISVRYEF